MKKVLMIVHLFHSSPRITGLAKYLPEFGWEPIILTIPKGENPNVQTNAMVIEVPYHNTFKNILKFLKKVFWNRFFNIKPNQSIGRHIEKQFGVTSGRSFVDSIYNLYTAIFYYPDSERCWRAFAVKAAGDLFEKEDIRAIISSSSPVTCHIVARYLKSKYNIPWIADLRDLWTQNHNYTYGPLRRKIEEHLEKKTLSNANILVTASPLWAEKLKTLHKKDKVYAITNGFDPDTIRSEDATLTPKFTITYTGQIYPEKQDPSKLFIALRELISDGTINMNDVEVRFYGAARRFLSNDIKKYDLSSVVKVHERVSRQISLKRQRESHVLLLLNWEDFKERGVYPLKVFEYLAARRPILATGGPDDDVIKELLNETNAGTYCKTIEDIKMILRELYSKYKNKKTTSYARNKEKINKYSYRNMAMKFAENLDSLLY